MEAYNPKSYWFSKLQDFRRCPAYFAHKHELKTPCREEKSADLAFGTAMHLGLNEMLQGLDGESTFQLFWDSSEGEGLAYGRLGHKELGDMGLLFLQRFRRLHLTHYTPVLMEERVYAKTAGMSFEGTPDFYGDYKGLRSIIDFKTSSKPYENARIRSDDQMTAYAWLLMQNGHPAPTQRVYTVFVKDPKNPRIQTLVAPLTGDHVVSGIDNILQMVDAVKSGARFKNPANCLMGAIKCPYFDVCHKE